MLQAEAIGLSPHLIYYSLHFRSASFFLQSEDSLYLFTFDLDYFLVYEYIDEQYVLVAQPFCEDQFWV